MFDETVPSPKLSLEENVRLLNLDILGLQDVIGSMELKIARLEMLVTGEGVLGSSPKTREI